MWLRGVGFDIIDFQYTCTTPKIHNVQAADANIELQLQQPARWPSK